jgi:VIT1/CCC1 family predicted Fe2+/Mn2+ transporter
LELRKFSYGMTSAVVTGMALVAGLDAAGGRRASIVAGLMIFALADNLTDSLSIHVYQEAERLERRAAFHATLTNFATRLALTLSFVLIVLLVPPAAAVPASVAWGVGLLVVLTILLARDLDVPVLPEIGRHLALAFAVIVASKLIGSWVIQITG